MSSKKDKKSKATCPKSRPDSVQRSEKSDSGVSNFQFLFGSNRNLARFLTLLWGSFLLVVGVLLAVVLGLYSVDPDLAMSLTTLVGTTLGVVGALAVAVVRAVLRDRSEADE